LNNILLVKTLGNFEISRSGKILETTNHTTNLLNLLKYFIINHGNYKSIDMIIEDLYKDKDYEDPKNAVQNMIYRLRKYFKNHDIFDENSFEFIYSNESYKMLTENVSFDFKEFEKKIQEAEHLQIGKLEKVNVYQEAVEIYRGEIFPELLYEDWVIPTRNYLSRLFIESVNFLLNFYKENKMIDEGIKLAEESIKIENYEEEFHIKYMDFLIEKNKRSEAKKHYEYITTLLYNQFGIRPNEEMQKIYNKIKENTINNIDVKSSRVKYLWEESKDKGGFYCTYEEFYPIYVLEKRRRERDGGEINPIYVSIESKSTEKISEDKINRIKKIFINSLRKGDVICNLSKNKLILLLPSLELDKVKFVVNRVKNRINSYKEFKNIEILIDEDVTVERNISLN
jgi:DNA-binding SARP family transcriptional activator